MGVRIKICGLTNAEDALAAARLGVDWLGFIFAPRSPRCVTVSQVEQIVAALSGDAVTVGVFVNTPAVDIDSVMAQCGLDIAQLHGEEEAGVSAALGPGRVWKAVSLRKHSDLEGALRYPAQAVLVDTMLPGRRGGTGRVGDWGLAGELARQRSVILAGGLRPENVAEAIRTVQPYGVDVGSGVEARPGKKDIGLLRAFVEEARAAVTGDR